MPARQEKWNPTSDELLKTWRSITSAYKAGTYNPDDIVGRKGWRFYGEMRRDDAVLAALSIKKFAILSAGWQIDTAKTLQDQQGAIEQTEFMKWTMYDMDNTVENFLIEMMTKFDFGFSLHEKVLKVIDEGPYAGKWGLKALKHKAPPSVLLDHDDYGNLTAIKQEGKEIPLEKVVLSVHDMEFSNWYGQSALRAVYQPYWYKKNILSWLAILLERFGIPPSVAKFPRNATQAQRTVMEEILKNLQAKTCILLPPEWELNFPEIMTEGSLTFLEVIRELNKAIGRGLLVPSLLGFGEQGHVGSFAQSNTQFDVFLLIAKYDQRYIAEQVVAEQIFRPVLSYNYPIVYIPVFRFIDLADDSKQQLYKLWIEAVDTGVFQKGPNDEPFFRTMLGMPERPEDVVTKEPSQDISSVSIGGEISTYAVKGKISPTIYDKRINFAKIDHAWEQSVSDGAGEIKSILSKSKDALIKKVERMMKGGLSATEIRRLDLKYINTDIKTFLKGWFEETYRAGHKQGVSLIPGHKVKRFDFVEPTEALDFFDNKAFYVSGVLSDDLTGEIKQTLMTGMKQGQTQKEIVSGLEDDFAPYLGDDTAIVDEEQVEPYRLETILRTNYDEAYSEGLMSSYLDPDLEGRVIAIKYSAILDSRTTPVCEYLHKVGYFKPHDPHVAKLLPPNHFNCRSIPTPILDRDGPIRFITQAEINRALELKHKKF